nr:glycoside hydrolase family 88 protein [Bifidobacterium amazonense]
MQRYSWEQGTAMQAFLEMNRMDVVIPMAKEAASRRVHDGRVAQIGAQDAATDPCAAGEPLIEAARMTHDHDLADAADGLLVWALHNAPRNRSGIVYHFASGTEFWADSLYMLPPFLAAAGHPDEALLNFLGYWDALYDNESGLISHMWDDGRQCFSRKAHWGTGNGWALAAAARMLGGLLTRDRYAAGIADITDRATTLLADLLRHMRPDGLFHDIVDDPSTFTETNLSQMTAYTIYRGIHDGWLSDDWMDAADRMRTAAEHKVDEYGFVHDACGAPGFDAPGFSPEAQAFHLMMEHAFRALAASR